MNNFDQSSSGVNIEMSLGYNEDSSRIYFEWFEESAARIRDGLWLYGDHDRLMFKKSQLNKMLKAELVELVEDCGQLYFAEGHTKQEIIEVLEFMSIYDYYKGLDTEGNLRTTPYPHPYVHLTGYSQGDSVEVIMLDQNLSDEDIAKSQVDLNQLFWDCPIYFELTVEGDVELELRNDDVFESPYEYDKDKVIEAVKAETTDQRVLTWLQDNLPTEPAWGY